MSSSLEETSQVLAAENAEVGEVAQESETNAFTKKVAKDHLAASLGITKARAGKFYDEMFMLINSFAHNGIPVRLPGIGTLVCVELPAGTARNPQNGEVVQVPARKKIKLRSKTYVAVQ